MKDRRKGIVYPKNALDINKAILLSINDASHAASYEGLANGQVAGNRSQSGRILALASPEFLDTEEGHIYMLEWHSTALRRVCRSILQAETLSMQLGSEEAEHVRQVLYYLKNMNINHDRKEHVSKATDHMVTVWCTDCRSLSDHLQNPAMAEVSDKRLAIDLSALRQDVWKRQNELIGNPTYADELPSDGPTKVEWINTKTMAADGLTKMMKSEQLECIMAESYLRVATTSTPVK